MIHKERIGNELYVYVNGNLLYKKWINKKHGIIFSGGFYGNFRSCDVWQHITDETILNSTKISEIK